MTPALRPVACIVLIVCTPALAGACTAARPPRAGTELQSSPVAEASRGQSPPHGNEIETVVVTPSRSEQAVAAAPTSVSVLQSSTITASPALDYADLLRGVPGLNVIRLNARDANMRARAATGIADGAQLLLIDGRPVYDDVLGKVSWDLLPMGERQIERIEISRGPSSPLWGANAMAGAIQLIREPPAATGNVFAVRLGGGSRNTGFGSLVWARAGGQLGYRLGASYLSQAGWDRQRPGPGGIVPEPVADPGTEQPKLDGRVDLALGEHTWWSLSAGYARSTGVLHTGIGPLDTHAGATLGSGRLDYNRRDLNARVGLRVQDTRGTYLPAATAADLGSRMLELAISDTSRLGPVAATYGAALRRGSFDASLAPGADPRTEIGVFARAAVGLGSRLSFDTALRVDRLSSLGGLVLSPRAALLVRPTGTPNHVVRVGFGRAFRAPSVIESHALATVFNVVPLPTGAFRFPTTVVGNPELTQESLDQVEIGYRGTAFDGLLAWDLAVYRSDTADLIDLHAAAFYTASNPPPGWPLPAFVLPPLGPIFLPATLGYRNVGSIIDKGLEVGLRLRPWPGNTLVVNYSYQRAPRVSGRSANEVNRPPQNRFGIRWSGHSGAWLYAVAYTRVDPAYWADVLDARRRGITPGYHGIDATVGWSFARGNGEVSLRGTNLTDEPQLQHILGAVIGRRIILELALGGR